MSADRNNPCPCGSGRKYKKCCLPKEAPAGVIEAGWLRLRRTEGELVDRLGSHLAQYYGPALLDEAWREYTQWPDEAADRAQWPEFETSFVPWLMFHWDPDLDVPLPDEDLRGLTPAQHFAKRRGPYLDSYEKRYLDEVFRQPFRFYMVVEAVPGSSLTLRDIMLQEEVMVHERQASKELRPGGIIFTQVVGLDGESVMLGCAPYVIPGRFYDAITEMRDGIAKHHPLTVETLRDFDIELRELYLDLRDEIVNPAAPRLANTDGDPIQMTRLEYDLDGPPDEALSALLPLTGYDEVTEFADDCERDASGGLVVARIPWLKDADPLKPLGTGTLLGQIEIRPGKLCVNVNSQRRAEVIEGEIERRLGGQARRQAVVIESMEQMMAAAAGSAPAGIPEGEQPPEIQALLERMNAEHWRTWPDIPLPALRGKTPRDAAKTAAGRERLEALFLEFAGYADAPGALAPDLVALRRELGM